MNPGLKRMLTSTRMEKLFLSVTKDIGKKKKFHLEFAGLVQFLCLFFEEIETPENLSYW